MLAAIIADLRRYPALWGLLGAAIICYPFVVSLAENEISWLSAKLLILDVYHAKEVSLAQLWADAQIWRWFTPVLIHFSAMHLIFNVAIAVEFGRRVELGIGHLGFALLAVWLAVASNLTQLQFSESPFFGGLSGVVYGLIGFTLVMARLQPLAPMWRVHQGFVIALLAFLVVFSTGITEFFGLHIANAAHWGGLIAGGVAGLAWGLYCRAR